MPISHVSTPVGRKGNKMFRSKISRFPGSRAGKSAPKPIQMTAATTTKKKGGKKAA